MSRVLVFQILFIASRSGLCLAFYNAYFLVFYVQKTVCNDCSLLSSQPFTCLCGGLNKAGMCQLLLPEELHRSNAGIAILHAEHAAQRSLGTSNQPQSPCSQTRIGRSWDQASKAELGPGGTFQSADASDWVTRL